MKKFFLFSYVVALAILGSAFSVAATFRNSSTASVQDTVDLSDIKPDQELPDLIVASITLNSGGSTFTVVISNVGTEPVSPEATFVIEGLVSTVDDKGLREEKAFEFSASALAPGESVSWVGSTSTRSSSSKQPRPVVSQQRAGEVGRQGEPEHDLPIDRPFEKLNVLRIKVSVDSEEDVRESDEANNTAGQTFEVIR